MYQTVVKQVQQGVWSPLYLLYGSETYLLNELLNELKKHVLREEANDFNYAVFDLEQEPIEALVQEAETLPFMAEKRLIVGTNAWFLTGTSRKTDVHHQLDALLNYMNEPLDSSIVVLTVSHDKLDERKKLVKRLKESGTVVRFAPLGTGELHKWIGREMSQYRAEITQEAARKLIEHTGNDLQLLHQECVKLATYVGEGGTVTAEHIQHMIPRTLEEDVFKLVDYTGKMNAEGALGVYYDLLKRREEPLKILSLIARQFRIMLQVKELGERGYSQKQIAAVLGLHPYPVKIAAEQGRRFSDKSLARLLKEVNRTDYEIKSGQKEKAFAVEWYILNLNHWVEGTSYQY